jgi:hypothetical protein
LIHLSLSDWSLQMYKTQWILYVDFILSNLAELITNLSLEARHWELWIFGWWILLYLKYILNLLFWNTIPLFRISLSPLVFLSSLVKVRPTALEFSGAGVSPLLCQYPSESFTPWLCIISLSSSGDRRTYCSWLWIYYENFSSVVPVVSQHCWFSTSLCRSLWSETSDLWSFLPLFNFLCSSTWLQNF